MNITAMENKPEQSNPDEVGKRKLEAVLAELSRPIGSMDPRLQRLLARRRRGMVMAASASTSADETGVIARVTDVDAWEDQDDVRSGAVLGDAGDDGTYLVTGRIAVERIEVVRELPFVESLKAAKPLQPALYASTKETGARPSSLPSGHKTNGGSGVVVGIVDFGCDFMHENFRLGSRTRIEALWNQNGTPNENSPFGYGRLFSPAEIEEAMRQPGAYGPYHKLRYYMDPKAHGTHVTDIAGGNGNGTGNAGMAPNASLIFVDASISDIAWQGKDVVRSSLGDSTQLLEAVQFIFEQAGDRPCVVNLSLGTNGGPHDGTSLVEQGLDRLVNQRPNRAVVIAAANSHNDGIHAAGQVAQNGSSDLVWRMPNDALASQELELWYSGTDRIAVELIDPQGKSIGRVAPGRLGELTDNGRVLLFVANRLRDPNNQDNMIGIFMEKELGKQGDWTVRLHGENIQDGGYHAWAERRDGDQSHFAPPNDNSHTIGSISTGHKSIVVGSYDAHRKKTPLSFFSSEGPTRDGRQKPEISAPGHGVHAANSMSKYGSVPMNGTSMAAPAVTGIVALMMAEAQARGIDLTVDQIRDILEQTARRRPPAGNAWHGRYGHGRISASAAVQAVIDLAPAQPPAGSGKTAKPAKKKASKKKK